MNCRTLRPLGICAAASSNAAASPQRGFLPPPDKKNPSGTPEGF
jgi:hypothetical protein